MKVTLNWLKDYVEFDWSPEELAERLTMLGLEVEGVEKTGGGFEGVVVAEVITRDKHPNADKLTLCQVNDGTGQRQIVCGATNFKAGDKVPLILPGATLPASPGAKPFTIKVGRIRGVESHGMMCSPKELGISEDAQGLLILPEDAKVGQPFAEHLGQTESDHVYDLEVTPNRPDLNSVIGIAREISAITGNPLKVPDPDAPTTPDPADTAPVQVRLEDPERCPRYIARVVRGVKVGPSPDWLRNTLEKVGIRSISNVVDVTNYVMLEIGQPLHAFDYHLLEKNKAGAPAIVVRGAASGESFTTLDGQGHELNEEMLLIADESKGIALAGVMGGLNTEINDQTVDVLIESAYFSPTNIRRTSKALGLRTESSYRFERGCDPNITEWASRRAAQLILETAGGQLSEQVADAYPAPVTPREVSLRHHKTDQLLGITIPAEDQDRLLKQLGLDPVSQSAESSTFRIPTFRVDLKRETDLIEEVCRLFGLDKVPSTPPRGAFGENDFDATHDCLTEFRRVLTGIGLNEAQGQTLIGEEAAAMTAAPDQLIRLAHPLSSDMNVLRPALLPGLLEMLRHNAHHEHPSAALFEIGRVFESKAGTDQEQWHLGIALTGLVHPANWASRDNTALWDIYDLKGILEEFTEHIGIRGIRYQAAAPPRPMFLEQANLQMGKQCVGMFGQLNPILARQFDLRTPVLLAELNLELILQRQNASRSFKPFPAYPGSRRDVAMFVAESVTHDDVLSAVRQAKAENLESVDLFDVFRGKSVPEGQKSMAYAFTYRSTDGTLTDAQINQAHQKVVDAFKAKLKADIREG